MTLKQRILRRKKARPSYPIVDVNNRLTNKGKGFKVNEISTTKYNRYNFLFKNLYEQFRRVTNIYFLAICIITLIPSISPLSPATSLIPLIFVLVVTAIKEGFEDFRRYQADSESNNREYLVWDGTAFSKVKSKDIQVGDIIKILNHQPFPSDIIMFNTNLDDGICYVETSQLDGETNLKMFKANQETNTLAEDQLVQLKAQVECELPNNNLYKFKGKLMIGEQSYSLSEKQLMLRGAKLRNTDWLIGVVVYCGKDTKLSLNQKNPPSKFSTVEKRLGRSVIGIFCFKLVLVLIGTTLGTIFHERTGKDSWYLWRHDGYLESDGIGLTIVKRFVSYFAILSFLIPMSLMVTLEVVKVSQAKFMEWDKFMSYKEKGTPIDETGATVQPVKKYMSVKNSNLNDELALVKYIFSDKTGTLTENKMVFSKCSINGAMFNNAINGELYEYLQKGQDDGVYQFLFNLSICHAAVVENSNTTEDQLNIANIKYQSQSPDEVALCDAAKFNQFIFVNRSTTHVYINVMGQQVAMELLAIMEFSSDRRRMSILVKDPQSQKILLYSKGADSVMMERLSQQEKSGALLQKTIEHISEYSKEGLRTLLLCRKEIPLQVYEDFASRYHNASTLIEHREEEMERLQDEIERDFDLLGCTAIEDKLQDGVPEAIDYLLKSNIKVWIITGDKQETAINIGYSCKLLQSHVPVVIINATSTEQCQEQINEIISTHIQGQDHHKISMVINGESLTFVLKDHGDAFLRIASRCHSVVCCRVTPLQKALIVKLVKTSTKQVCLSIGDGANDVSMIQEAHIGVGIFGNEGTQAARASDYALLRFRHLTRLVTIHGRYSMVRNSLCIKFSLYKNMAFFLVQFWFSIFSGWTSQTLYLDWLITLFNILYTSVPPFFIAVFEKDINETQIEKNPGVFKDVQDCHLFKYRTIFSWLTGAFYHSLVFFFGIYFLLYNDDVVNQWGKIGGLDMMGSFTSTFAALTILFKATIEIKNWNVIVHIGVWGSMLVYLIIALVLNAIITQIPLMYMVFNFNMSLLKFYLMVIIMIFIALLPDFSIKFYRRMLYPKEKHILQEYYVMKVKDNKSPDVELTSMK
ncbi:transmembrane protein [Tieghemostelium lacteum]|uniref:Phospholipid-transporting ATPase n=1 Tax=Tieghemostelium lacteum TaxID=361077 RepID=A0A151ZKE8_TIELA|nr:transmembrane protein [Tieghemostelium lacteum]|eukprot:KYQ94389.1 transmembrane protein [Tieghemostelium lacteum]